MSASLRRAVITRQLQKADFAPSAQVAAIVYNQTTKSNSVAPLANTLEIYDYLLQHDITLILPYGPLRENMTSSIKPEVYNV